MQSLNKILLCLAAIHMMILKCTDYTGAETCSLYECVVLMDAVCNWNVLILNTGISCLQYHENFKAYRKFVWGKACILFFYIISSRIFFSDKYLVRYRCAMTHFNLYIRTPAIFFGFWLKLICTKTSYYCRLLTVCVRPRWAVLYLLRVKIQTWRSHGRGVLTCQTCYLSLRK